MRIHTLTVALVLLAVPVMAQTPKKNPCSMITKAEVQEVIGAGPVGDPAPNKLNATVCDYGIPGGVMNVTVPAGTTTADQFLAQAKKANLKIAEAPGIGDKSFYVSPGYGMAQLNTFKGTSYVIVTVMAAADEQKNRAIAAKLMQKALPRM